MPRQQPVFLIPHRSLLHTATHCNTLQRTATRCNALQCPATPQHSNALVLHQRALVQFLTNIRDMCDDVADSSLLLLQSRLLLLLQYVAVCSSVLQCVAVCRSVSQCVATCRSMLQCVTTCRSVLQKRLSRSPSLLQSVAVCRSVSKCVAVCCKNNLSQLCCSRDRCRCCSLMPCVAV